MSVSLRRCSHSFLAELFAKGHCPSASSLLGPTETPSEWRVDMLTGPFPNLGGWPFRHRKRFFTTGGGLVNGCNIFFINWRWGHFFLNDDALYIGEGDASLIIDYRREVNGELVREHLLDKVRTTDDPTLLIGEFYWRSKGGARLMAYFSLTRLPQPAK